MPLTSGLSELLAQAVQSSQPGRRYPAFSAGNVPYSLDILGEVIPPSDLPNPHGIKHFDPLERTFIRPQTAIDSDPWPA
jgi:hypothetical protein